MKNRQPMALPAATDIESAPLLSTDTRDFTEWMEQILKKQDEPSSLYWLAAITGFIVGVIGAFVVYPFGVLFGKEVAGRFDVPEDSDKEKYIGVFFGIMCYLPIIALAGLSTMSNFTSYFFPSKFDIKRISKQNRAILRGFLNGLTLFLGLWAALSPAFMAYLGITSKTAVYPMAVFAYASGFMFKIDSMRRLINKVFNKFSSGATPEIQETRKFLISTLMRGTHFIRTSDDEVFRAKYNYLFSDADGKSRTEAILTLNGLAESQDMINPFSCPRVVAEAIGFITGCISSYIFYALGRDIAKTWLYWMTGYMSDSKEEFTQNLIAICVLIPWAAVNAESTWRRFERLYLYLTQQNSVNTNVHRPGLRKFFTLLAWVTGFTSDIPHLLLTMDATKDMSTSTQYIVNGCAVIGPTCVNSEALDMLLNLGWDGFIEPRINPTPTNTMKRFQLMMILGAIHERLERLPDNQVIALQRMIAPAWSASASSAEYAADTNCVATLKKCFPVYGAV